MGSEAADHETSYQIQLSDFLDDICKDSCSIISSKELLFFIEKKSAYMVTVLCFSQWDIFGKFIELSKAY